MVLKKAPLSKVNGRDLPLMPTSANGRAPCMVILNSRILPTWHAAWAEDELTKAANSAKKTLRITNPLRTFASDASYRPSH
jgi:hypothetical protein